MIPGMIRRLIVSWNMYWRVAILGIIEKGRMAKSNLLGVRRKTLLDMQGYSLWIV